MQGARLDAAAVVAALGGSGNISELEPCITRVRVRVENADLVNDSLLQALGAKGVIHTGKELQIVVGPVADELVDQINALVGTIAPAEDAPIGHPEDAELGFAIASEVE